MILLKGFSKREPFLNLIINFIYKTICRHRVVKYQQHIIYNSIKVIFK